MVRFLSYDVATTVHFFIFSIVVLALSTVTGKCQCHCILASHHLASDLRCSLPFMNSPFASDYGFDESARDRFSNIFVFSRGHLFVMNVIVGFYVPRGRRFSIASCLICVFSSVIIGIATIPKTSPIVAISLFIVAIFGETVLILASEFTFAPPVHLHLMSERHGGASAAFSLLLYPSPPPPQASFLSRSASPSFSSRCARPSSALMS
jgi:hypothetical protein